MSDISSIPLWNPAAILVEDVVASTNLLDFAEMPGRTLEVYCASHVGEKINLYANEAEGTLLVVTSGGTFMEFKEVSTNVTRH